MDVERKVTWQTTWPTKDQDWRSSPSRDGFARPQVGYEPCTFVDSFLSSDIALPGLDPHNGVNTIGFGNVRGLRACDHYYTSSTLIGGEGGATPSLLHTRLEGPVEYVNARRM